MMNINIAYPQTNVDLLDQIAKEYLEIRLHEFYNIINSTNKCLQCSFYNEYKIHEYHGLISLNLIISTTYKDTLENKDCVSFHIIDNKLIRIEDLIKIEDIKIPNIDTLDYNNFYLTEEGLKFIYIVDNQEKEILLENKYLNYLIPIQEIFSS